METTMNLQFSSPIEASDAGRRIISGIVVPFGTVGNTSAGPVIFEAGSISIGDPTKIKLLAQHSQTDPIGRAMSFQESATEIRGQFKVSASQKGSDYLVMASEDLISGLSVGVEVIASKPGKDGTLYVQRATLKEVSLVESPAFTQAVVTNVAASESEAELNTPEETQSTTESEAIVETQAPEAVTPEAPAAETVEASRPTVKAASPYITSTVRSPIQNMGGYALHSIKAKLGDEESALYVKAAADSMTTNTGFNPTQYLSSIFVSNTNFGRPAVDACGRAALPTSGLTINIPSLITPTDTAPTVAATAESAAPSNTGMTSEYLSYTVSKYAGQQTISLELIERSDPVFMDQLMIQLERAYLKATDAAVIAALVASGTAATATAATSAGLISYLSTESAATYAGTSYFAKNVVLGTGTWAAVMGYVDSTGRPIYNASQPWNAAGNVSNSSIKGNLLGLDAYVDVNAVATNGADNSAFVIAPEAVTVFESATAMFSVNVVSSMSVNLAIYGYMVPAVLQPKGVRKYKTA
jgi:HK97 family phage prohead protease/HK97 family phage major capsid protein